jgi:hypothetical protein
MARRRVFHIKVECPGITMDLGRKSNKNLLIGKTATLEKSSSPFEVVAVLDGRNVGRIDGVVGSQVASGIDRGQTFTALIENAYQNYDEKFKPTTALLHLKVEYLLEKGQPAIEVPKAPVDIRPSTAKSFFTTVAGVTHDSRQRIVARCTVGESLTLVRDSSNRFDSGAIKVIRLNGEQLGYIPAHVSRGGDPSGLAFQMDRGDSFQCRISNLTGGDGLNLGVNIEVTEYQESEEGQSTPEEPTHLNNAPAHRHLKWIFVAVAVVLLVVVLIAYNRS